MRRSPGNDSRRSSFAGSSSSIRGSPRRYRPCETTRPGSRAAIFAINSSTSRSVRNAQSCRAAIARRMSSFDHDLKRVDLAFIAAVEHLELAPAHELAVQPRSCDLGAAGQPPLHVGRLAVDRAQGATGPGLGVELAVLI